MSSFKSIEADLKKSFRKHVKRVADEAKRQQSIESPVDKGLLKRSHITEKVNDLTYDVGPDSDLLERTEGVDYAPFVFFGTRPHTIRVKNAKVLTDGSSFFGRSVKHPGTAANRWVERADRKITPKIERLYEFD